MKKHILFSASLFLLLGSCSNNNWDGNWTITFESNGGSTVEEIKVKDGDVATKPSNPTKSGYSFQNWCVDSYLTTVFDWDNPITANWTLYASWKKEEGGSSSSSSSSSSSGSSVIDSSPSSEEPSKKGHGPEGSTLTSWYLIGSGSLWGNDGWEVAGGVQLFTNPASETDKGCILGLTLKEGDLFKVTNGSDIYFGYEKVDKSESEINMGLTNFEGSTDGYGGQNFKCKVSGTYDMYVNGSGVFWIQNAA